MRVLAIDDDARMCELIRRTLASFEIEVETYTDPHQAARLTAEALRGYDAVLCDVDMPKLDGITLLGELRRIDPSLPIIMLTGDDSSETAVRALKAGAFHYIVKRKLATPEETQLILERAASVGRLRRHAMRLEDELGERGRFDELIGESPPMRELFSTIARVARLDVSVLILGESGTGKELIARAIHRRSARSGGAFVAINCGALPENLIDSELFGHVRGAFTGAVDSHAGAFERAHKGTLLLDEIGDVPAAVQIRLLRVLQEGELRRVGGSKDIPVDARVIAATHVDIDDAVSRQEFREDLFFRLNVVRIEVPPLRHRGDDVLMLAAHFLQKHAGRVGKKSVQLHDDAVELLLDYRWPGNVRELENALLSALALCPGEVVEPAHLPRRITSAKKPAAPVPLGTDDDLGWSEDMNLIEARSALIDRFERAYAADKLRRAEGNISKAARLAGVDRSNFKRLLSKHGLHASDFLDDE